MNKTKVICDKIILICPNCKETTIKEGMSLHGSSRNLHFDGRKGDCRCEDCGFQFEFEAKINIKIEEKGLSCGVCNKIGKKLWDNYFCKECYIKHLKEDYEYYNEITIKAKKRFDLITHERGEKK